MKRIIFFFVFGVSLQTSAQSENQAVETAIQQFFAGMHASDSLMIRKVTFPETSLQSVMLNAEGKAVVRTTPFQDFVKQIGTPVAGRKIEERISRYSVQIDGPLATAWTPYTFWVNGEFSHCGVNTFTLVKSPTGWKIWSIMDTRRKGDCPN